MNNTVQESGKVLNLTAPRTHLAGTGALRGNIFAIAIGNYTVGATNCPYAVEGVFDLAKDGSAFAEGADIYWDNGAFLATSTAAGNLLIGQAVAAAGAPAATVRIHLVGKPYVFDLAAAGVTADAAEVNLIDGSVAGQSIASKALVLDANRATDYLRAKTEISVGGTGVPGAANVASSITKQVDALTDTVATDVLTVTIPNVKAAAIIEIDAVGVLGAGGAIGESEAVCLSKYQVVTTRTPGVNAVAAISAAIGGAKNNVAGANVITSVVLTVSAIAGAVGAANSFTVKCAITKAAGASDNHKVVLMARVVNFFAGGVTIA